MNLKGIFTASFFVRAIFVISLFILIFISGVSYKHTTALSESSDLLVQSYKIQIQLEQLLSFMKDAETGQRGYIISRDSVFLEPYNSAHEKVSGAFLILKFMTAGHKRQQENLDTLSQLINLRFDLLDFSLKRAAISSMNDEILDKNLLRGKVVMDNIRKQIDKMISMEDVFFKDHQKKYAHEIYFTPIITFFFLLFSLVIFIISFIKISWDLNVLKKSNDELLIKTESMKHAEVIGEFCITQWDMETNNLTYSDNLYALLGCEPQSFEPTIDNYLEFVHPDDRYIVSTGAEKAADEGLTYPRFYRVIRKDGELRYFRSMGKFIPDSQRRKTHIGIIKDVTQIHLGTIELEERNHELEQSVRELESFNRVASHDLQEPLRKIQTFISRISEKESSNLSGTGKDYFARILVSVDRMRILINDLLLFSRTNKTEKAFEIVDLNQVLESAIQELSQDIEDKNAIFHFAPLPDINAIKFQIQQLFTNLIGNSLKYSRPGVPPVINISCEKVQTGKYPVLVKSNKAKFYKISISDNGLGFDQQYAEDIFVLFHRLHNNSDYPGSGIGLSICKKIVENHNGFILADGRPGEGATFTFFLPE